MAKRMLSLKTRLSLTYGIVSLLLFGLLLLVTHTMMNNYFHTYVVKQREQTAENVVKTVVEQLKKTDMAHMQFTELGYAMLNEGLVLSVWDDQDRQVYCIHCNDVMACDNMLHNTRCITALRDPSYVGMYMEMEYPLMVNGTRMGALRFGYSGPYYYTQADLDFTHMIDVIYLIAGILCTLLAAGFGYFMARGIVKPIREIGSHTSLIAQGNYAPYTPKHPYAKEMKDLSESVNLLSQTLEAQQKARERVVRDYAHELRTPLSVLQANLEAFQDGVWEPTPQRLNSCYEEIQRLNRMLEKLEELARLYDPGTEHTAQQLALDNLIEDCLDQFQPLCAEKQISLTSGLAPVSIKGNRDELKQVLVNLLANAVQYTPAGGSIHVSLAQESDTAVIAVQDTGIGIDEKDLPFIFDYLYRADPSRSRHTGGSGIGLSIVQKIVREHGGDVSVTSKPGEGSVFTVKLPVQH